jgi:uncharacterized protein YecE (DUF72 family)
MLIGTSGWQYPHWRGGLYPEGLAVPRWLGHYATRFATVEVNNVFYRLPELSTFRAWSQAVGDDFVFAVKASRYLTHVRRLRQPEEPVRLFLERASGLGARLGPVLLQLPPNLALDLDALDRALACFPRDVRVAVEFRHDSWWTPGARAVLERQGAAVCLADRDGRRTPRWRTADWGYLRLHAGRARPPSCYGRAALQTWADELAELWPPPASLYVYFNNDGYGCAPHDARWLAAAARRAGLAPSRVPSAKETPLAGP